MPNRIDLLWIVLAGLLSASPAQAQWGFDVSWGFMQGKGVFLDDNSFGDTVGGSAWTYATVGISYGNLDSTRTAYGVRFGGFTSSSSTIEPLTGIPVTLAATVGSGHLIIRQYLTQPGAETRMFIQGGPGIATTEAEIDVLIVNLDYKEEDFAFTVGIGAHHCLNKDITLLLNANYNYVKVEGSFDPSTFTATVGLGFGG